ncbi:cadherin domain-containing protein [Yoonia maricola]|uniref:Cadherin domain-containing protein n=1 Tax=Yoonia maricola TaxID=420999 RepID=A0A2M8W653_9RHOB|nr:SdrD B-like domain-containing protein [Yoonia maricola]PJI86372.1 cadherin domain-containing protein [Yoonia maricola]
MTYQNYTWTAFSEKQILEQSGCNSSVSIGDVFVAPEQAEFTLQVTDNDDKLSGDCRDEATDSSQKAFVNGHAIDGKDMYVEKIYVLRGSDGNYYHLAEIEIEDYKAPGNGDDFFSFVGDVPPAGVTLKVKKAHDVSGDGIPYADFMSIPTADSENTAPTFDNLPDNGVVRVDENTTDVIDINTIDADGDTVTYSIVPGDDSASFEIDPDTGELSFVAAPDFEKPGDVIGRDNTYDVTIRADDGQGGVTEKTLWVKVRDVADCDAPKCIVIEAENMHLSGFKAVHGDKASDGGLVKLAHAGGTGEISTTFGGEAGIYDLSLFVQDESDGQSEITIKVNGEEVAKVTLDADTDGGGNNNGRFSEITLSDVTLNPGDVVAIQATGDGGEFVRIDKIELCQNGTVCPDGFTLLDFEGFDAGTVVDNQFAGVTITAQRDRNNTDENDAMLFDSANPTGGDNDLAYDNQGNLLIVSEDNDSSDPDDAVGGVITFDFDAPSDLHDIKIFDIEEPGGTITLTFASGEVRVIDIPAAGDNSEQTIALDAADVTQMEIALVGSGAIDDLCWAPGITDPGTATLGGRVFMDADGNDVDDTEMGVADVTVTLLDADGETVATTTTGADGSYLFEDLAAGDYTVVFPTDVDGKLLVGQDVGGDDTVDSDADQTTGATAPVSVGIGDDIRDVDAGVADPGTATLGGVFFVDADQDDVESADDTAVSGATVQLVLAGVVVATTTTGADGSYLFEDLDAGEYSVIFTNPGDQVFVAPNAGADDTIDSDAVDNGDGTATTGPITVAIGDDIRDVDAGITDPDTGAISGVLFVDEDGSDTQSAGDTPVAGVTVTLLQDGVPVATTTTGPDGSYLFDELAPGDDYSVVFDNPGDEVFVTQDAGGDDTVDSDVDATGTTGAITVTAGETTPNVDAGITDPGTATLGGRVFMDADGNDVDDTEMGVADVTVTLLDADGETVATTTTGADGSYLFEDLAAGDYTVVFPTDVDGKLLVGQDVGGDDTVDSDADQTTGATAPVSVGIGDDIRDVDAGVADPGTATLGGVFFVDADQDDVESADDTAVSGATVQLVLAGVVVATTTTGADGSYLFEDLDAGEYSVIFTNPGDQVFVAPNAGADDTIDSDAVDNGDGTATTGPITVAIGDDIRDVDAGITDPDTGAISGVLFVDEDGSDTQSAGDTPVAGVTVTLLQDGVPVATTTTGPDGSYLFDELAPGDDYSVVFDNPGDEVFVTQDAGGDDTVDSDVDATGTTGAITVTAGETTPNVDAGITDPGTASIGDTVFIDANGNGAFDDGEETLAGVAVSLLDDAGNEIAATTTDADGQYLFDDLDAGTYSVLFDEVDGFDFTTTDAGGDDTVDSDADQTTGQTGDIVLDIGEADLSVDAGFVAENVAPVAVDDAGTTCALKTTTIDVLANDTDADGDVLTVATVNGVTLATGESTTLDSGAVVTLNESGTLDYDSTNAVIDGVAAADMLVGTTYEDSFTYTISDGQGGTDDGQATVTVNGELNTVDTIADTLPTEAVVVQGGFAVGAGYSSTIDGTGDSRLDGLFIESAYCIERQEDFVADIDVTMNLAAGTESAIDADAFSNNLVENLDAINWLLNQNFTEQSNGDTSGATAGRNYTEAEIQHAIWGLTDGNSQMNLDTFIGGQYNGTQENVDELLELALANGEGFEAGEGDLLTLILDPTEVQVGVAEADDYDQAFIVTVSFDDFMQDSIC